jgi:hypothetical protein
MTAAPRREANLVFMSILSGLIVMAVVPYAVEYSGDRARIPSAKKNKDSAQKRNISPSVGVYSRFLAPTLARALPSTNQINVPRCL